MRHTVRDRPLPVVTTACAVLVGIASLAAPAGGHAVLTDSSPKDNAVLTAPPTEVVLTFASRVEKGVFKATLRDAKGDKIDLPPAPQRDDPPERIVIPLPPLAPGAYRLEYQVLASDGHTTPGAIRFTVAKKEGGP